MEPVAAPPKVLPPLVLIFLAYPKKKRGGEKVSNSFTDEADGGREEAGQILAPMIRDGDLEVLDGAGILKDVGQVRGHIHHKLEKGSKTLASRNDSKGRIV